MSGLVIPLPLFPEWSQSAIRLLPFRCFLDIPFRLYMGHIPVQETISLFLFQMLWVVLLIIPGRLILRSGTKRIVIQGG
jgi:ABC-2 type transport system permease protein